jgi:hypothetical protein
MPNAQVGPSGNMAGAAPFLPQMAGMPGYGMPGYNGNPMQFMPNANQQFMVSIMLTMLNFL